MFYTKELFWGALQRGGADVLGFLEKEKETALGSITCLRGELLRFGERWHRIFSSLDTWTRMHRGQWEQCQMMANCDLSKFLNSFKGGKPIEASFYLLPTDRLRAQDPKGYRKCSIPLLSSGGLSQQEPSEVWFGLRWKEDLCRRWDQGKGLAFRNWRNEERLEKLLFPDSDEINFHTFSRDQLSHLCCGIFPSIQIEIASINSWVLW